MDIQKSIELYQPYNEQEECDKAVMLQLLTTHPDIFVRENQVAHMTASSWLLNRTHDKVLMIYHNIYHSWAWTGGHADGEKNLLAVAIKEAQEETGVTDIRPVSEDIFSIETLTVDGHEKRGAYVSSHLHLNVTYLLEADEAEVLRVKPDENSGVKWFSLEEALEACTEPWMIERIYKKLNAKLVDGAGKTTPEASGAAETTHGMRSAGMPETGAFAEVAPEASDPGESASTHIISDETIEYIGILSKLELIAAEKEQAKKDIGEMITYIDKLNELDTSDVEPMSHIFPVNNVFREDVVTNGDGSADALENAPERKNGGFWCPGRYRKTAKENLS